MRRFAPAARPPPLSRGCSRAPASRTFICTTPIGDVFPVPCIGHEPRAGERMISTADKRRTFRALHESGCFVIPNPWDVGSALFLQRPGFKALASTSSGFAWSQGRPDNGVPRDRVLEHLAALAAATEVPLNADFENGFAADAAGVAESVRMAVETGIAGISIEDSVGPQLAAARPSGAGAAPLFDLSTAVERVGA